MKLSFRLLSAAALAPLASADYKMTYSYKDDFFLRFCDLDIGLGPAQAEALIKGLAENNEAFKRVWGEKIAEVQGGCTVVNIPDPEYTICEWKHPERYDVAFLPLAGQCHAADNCYVQRFFVQMTNLELLCEEEVAMEDLMRGEVFSEALKELIPDYFVDVEDVGGIDSVEEVEVVDEICNAVLSINRYSKIDVALKCLKEPYGQEEGDKLSAALDLYFETYIAPQIEDKVEEETPLSAVYNIKSPFIDDAVNYCKYKAYHPDGSLADQYVDDDGDAVTIYVCGFDLVWFKDMGFEDSLLDDFAAIVQDAFAANDPPFLTFLQGMYPDEQWVANTNACAIVPNNLIPPTTAPLTPNPTTASPTTSPTKSPTKVPTSSPTDEPTAVPSQSPTTSPSESPTNNPSTSAGPTSPTDTPVPTESPTTAAPTRSPTDSPTRYPTKAPTNAPTEPPTNDPTKAPTAPPMVITTIDTQPDDNDCTIETNFTEEAAPTLTVGTCGNGKRGDGVCSDQGACCSQWGYCGFTDEYCKNTLPTPEPIDPNAGRCGLGDGNQGDGTCLGKDECCSQWGYCGTGNKYCVTTIDTDTGANSEGLCGAGGAGEGECKQKTHCCSKFGFCGDTQDYCDGYKPRVESDAEEYQPTNDSFIPAEYQAEFGFRCGFTETDARSNCKKPCTHHVQCSDGEECWGIQLNYCNTFEPEGSHPVCTDLERANTDSRCGLNEASARGHCGEKCTSNSDCEGEGEYCFPVMENLCDCHMENLRNAAAEGDAGEEGTTTEDTPVEPSTADVATSDADEDQSSTTSNATDDSLIDYLDDGDDVINPFQAAKEKIQPYFVVKAGEGNVEGLARDNASFQVNVSVALVAIASLNIVLSYFM